MENSKNSSLSKLIPVMLCFFAMGFVDLVGIASNYVKADLGLSDSQANIFPSLVFFWFLIFSVPTGMLMSRIGQQKTVLLSLIVTFASLLLPVFGDSYMLMLISFSLLGIGNALMQTSLNPLLSNIVRGDRLASSLTFGQFVKAIASFLAPYIAMWGATQAIPTFDLGWRILFPIYMIVAVIAILLLNVTQIEEEKEEGKPSTFGQCIALLGKPFILLCFIGIMCHVGIDVGTNTTAPKILMERIGMGLDDAAFATSLYFIFRTAGCFLGSFILRKMSPKSFFGISVVMMFPLCYNLKKQTQKRTKGRKEMAEEIITSTNAETATDHEYNASEIQVLKGLEAVRKRPGMYIGSTGERGLHHLVYEIVDNAIDEALAGYCDHIEVKILKDNIIQVTDNGRGIPVDIQADTGLPAVTVVYTILHAGGKFGGENSGYKVAGGLHGVGASVVNACSEWLTVDVRRDGKEYEQTFRRGDPDGPLKCIGTVADGVTGTRVTFKPDPEMF